MYAYIIGEVTSITPKYIVVDNHGIGYEIIVANPYAFMNGETLKVYTYQYVREDINVLYGFKSKEEKELFLKLISVSGIGPKSALSILASASVDEIVQAIETRNDLYLKKFPGIGPKASQQIILDLKGKVNFESNGNLKDSKSETLVEALVSLGYTKKESEKVVSKLDISKDESSLIKEALKMLNA